MNTAVRILANRDHSKYELERKLQQRGFESKLINKRDKIFHQRMRAELELGQVVAFVGAPHLKGMGRLLVEDGYQVKGPWLPQ
jgi:uncharacterized protein YbaP (TraB family)